MATPAPPGGPELPAPASPGGLSSTATWANPTQVSPTQKKFAEERLAKCELIATTDGGPAQYLRKVLQEPDARNSFLDYLLYQLPMADDKYYHTDKHIPTVDSKELSMSPPTILHVAALAYKEDASMNSLPGAKVFTKLIELYLSDGFCSHGEPLLILQPKELLDDESLKCCWNSSCTEGPLRTFSVGYTKGTWKFNCRFMVTFLFLKESSWNPACWSPSELESSMLESNFV